MVSRPAAVVEGPLAYADHVDAGRIPVQFLDFAVGCGARALVLLPVNGIGVGDDAQVDVRIRAGVAAGTRAEQDDPVRADHFVNHASYCAGFRVGCVSCRELCHCRGRPSAPHGRFPSSRSDRREENGQITTNYVNLGKQEGPTEERHVSSVYGSNDTPLRINHVDRFIHLPGAASQVRLRV